MAFDDIQRKRVENTVSAFVERRRPPLDIRDQLDLGFALAGPSVEIFEIRPRWNTPGEKVRTPVAKATWVQSRNEWRAYWMRADGKWHPYAPRPAVDSLDDFLTLVEEDAHACFFG